MAAWSRSLPIWSLCAALGAWWGYSPVAQPPERSFAEPCEGGEVLPDPVGVGVGSVRGAPPVAGESRGALLTPLECALRLQEDRLREMDAFFAPGSEARQWSADVDVEAEREAFADRITEGLERCGSEARILRIDCSEPPCVGLAEGAYDALGCGAELFGEAYQADQELLCPDGTVQHLSLVAPAEPDDALVADTGAPPASMRYLARFAELRDEVRCVDW